MWVYPSPKTFFWECEDWYQDLGPQQMISWLVSIVYDKTKLNDSLRFLVHQTEGLFLGGVRFLLLGVIFSQHSHCSVVCIYLWYQKYMPKKTSLFGNQPTNQPTHQPTNPFVALDACKTSTMSCEALCHAGGWGEAAKGTCSVKYTLVPWIFRSKHIGFWLGKNAWVDLVTCWVDSWNGDFYDSEIECWMMFNYIPSV